MTIWLKLVGYFDRILLTEFLKHEYKGGREEDRVWYSNFKSKKVIVIVFIFKNMLISFLILFEIWKTKNFNNVLAVLWTNKFSFNSPVGSSKAWASLESYEPDSA